MISSFSMPNSLRSASVRVASIIHRVQSIGGDEETIRIASQEELWDLTMDNHLHHDGFLSSDLLLRLVGEVGLIFKNLPASCQGENKFAVWIEEAHKMRGEHEVPGELLGFVANEGGHWVSIAFLHNTWVYFDSLKHTPRIGFPVDLEVRFVFAVLRPYQ